MSDNPPDIAPPHHVITTKTVSFRKVRCGFPVGSSIRPLYRGCLLNVSQEVGKSKFHFVFVDRHNDAERTVSICSTNITELMFHKCEGGNRGQIKIKTRDVIEWRTTDLDDEDCLVDYQGRTRFKAIRFSLLVKDYIKFREIVYAPMDGMTTVIDQNTGTDNTVKAKKEKY